MDSVEFVTEHMTEQQPGFQCSQIYQEAAETNPMVFAIFLDPPEFAYWEYIHPHLVRIIGQYFEKSPFPIRYYVNSMTYWSSGVAPETIPPEAGKDPPKFGGPGAEETIRMRFCTGS